MKIKNKTTSRASVDGSYKRYGGKPGGMSKRKRNKAMFGKQEPIVLTNEQRAHKLNKRKNTKVRELRAAGKI